MKELLVLVPKPGTPAGLTIDHGSGVVCDPESDAKGRVQVYFEGNRFGADMRTFGERVLHAAGRLDKNYPTIARGVFDKTDFDQVGTFSYSEDWKQTAIDITDRTAVDRWTA